MEKDNGGPAYPRAPFTYTTRDSGLDWDAVEQRGMSLRDYFAGQALVGYLAGWPHDSTDFPSPEATAKIVLRYADAMIAERGKQR